MSERSKITVARFSAGVAIRVEGPGTIGESPLVHAFAEEVLRDRSLRVIVNVRDCTYMDSTFLGGLISLFRRHGATGKRFAIFAPEPQRTALFGQSRLDTVLPFVDSLPVEADEGMPLEAHGPDSAEDLTRYVIECHRRLAELGGPDAPDFAHVADALSSQLDGHRRR
ncbi:MAG TPA: STAS domain-containing protein [Kofleriaceae bacterium]|nr:STAS domain-containing protein [Kofleriaceae bacterium]